MTELERASVSYHYSTLMMVVGKVQGREYSSSLLASDH